MALPRVVEDAVRNTVQRITCRKCSRTDRGNFAGRDVTGGVCECGNLNIVNSRDQQMRRGVCWSAGKDALVVLWKTLSFHQRLASPIGAAFEKGPLGFLTIESSNDGFGLLRHLMNGSVPEVEHFVRGSERPACIPIVYDVTTMAGICGGSSVAAAKRCRHSVEIHESGKSPIPDRKEFAVPVQTRNPDFEFNVGVGSRLNHRS